MNMPIAPVSFSAALPQPAPVAAVEPGQPAAVEAVRPGDSCCISDQGMKTMLGMLLIAALAADPDKKKDEKSLMAELLIGAALLQTLADSCPFVSRTPEGCYTLDAPAAVDTCCAASMFPAGFAGGGMPC